MGEHNVLNICAALAALRPYDFPSEQLIDALEKFQPLAMRQEFLQLAQDIMLINDTYNASPLSMQAALTLLGSFHQRQRRIAVLGEMLELGRERERYHFEIGKYCTRQPIYLLITVGRGGQWIAQGALHAGFAVKNCIHFEEKTELEQALTSLIHPGDIILFKASRLIALESVISYIRGQEGNAS
jgi:UDP-N-acetylmuramoyl-tripeptide--D-alanyl-D-alanine ligase